MTDSREQLLIVNEFHPETVSRLDNKYQTHHLWEAGEDEKKDLIAALNGKCRAVASASWLCDDIIYELDSLEIIAAFGVGVDAINFDKTGPANIKVSNTPDVLNDAVADLAMALVLATTRNLIAADKFVRSGSWEVAPFPFGTGLAGKTLGIAGLGRIGEAIARRALPFNLNIAYHNRNPKHNDFQYYPDLCELAKNSDILLCMLPGGDTTDNLINAEVLDCLGPQGIFINVGRGNSVDEQALFQALAKNRIAGAGLDVYKNEPSVPDEFLGLDNIVLLPHIGSATVETRRAMGNLVIENLEAFFAGKPLLTEVAQN